jgi:hypothetical protein
MQRPDHGPFEHVERGEQRGRAGAIQGLDLGFFVDREDDRVLGPSHLEADDVLELGGEIGSRER